MTGIGNIVIDTFLEIDAEDVQIDVDSSVIINVGTDVTLNIDSALDLRVGQEYYLRTVDASHWEHGVTGFGAEATCCNHRTSHYTYNKTFGLDFNDIGTDTTSVNFIHRFNVVSAVIFDHYRFTAEDTGAVFVFKDTSGNQDTVFILNRSIAYFNSDLLAEGNITGDTLFATNIGSPTDSVDNIWAKTGRFGASTVYVGADIELSNGNIRYATTSVEHEVIAAVNAGSHSVAPKIASTILNNAGIATFTLTLPDGVYDGQQWTLTNNGAIVALTLAASLGNNLGLTITALPVNGQRIFTYNSSNNTWY